MTVAEYPPVDGSQPCCQVDGEFFFPTVGLGASDSLTRAALDLCASCDFVDACLEYALVNNVTGIWGGTTHLARKRIRRERGISASEPGAGLDNLLGVSA